MAALQASCQELSARRKSGEKRDKENLKLKSIISSQDERVSEGFTGLTRGRRL